MAKKNSDVVTIVSTLPYNSMYCKNEVTNGVKRRTWSIRIAGGSGVVQGKKHLWTPTGVSTEIDREGYEILKTIPQFQNDIKGGVLKVIESPASKVDADEEAEKDMNTSAGPRPITENDLKDAGATIDSNGDIDITGDDAQNGTGRTIAKKIANKKVKRA